MLTNLVSWLASKLIRRRAKTVSGLDIDVGARSNGDVLAGNLPRVQAKFDRIVLESLQISGGGQMEITGLNVRVLGLLLARRLNIIRRPFEICGQYVLTQQVSERMKGRGGAVVLPSPPLIPHPPPAWLWLFHSCRTCRRRS